MTIRSEVVLPSTNLSEDISFFTKQLGLRMEMIYPAAVSYTHLTLPTNREV